MYCENVSTSMRYQILPWEFETDTLLDGLVIADINGKKHSRYKNLFKKEPLLIKY